jgi:hypothetical protein
MSILLLGAAAGVARSESSAGAAAGPSMVLPFIHDDYPKALAEARARKVPLFIETWAPW